MDLPEPNTWLDTFLSNKCHPDQKLQTMQILCDYFGHPEKSCPCFHVAGSKGKGTIAADIAAILLEAGFKTGAYMSPHVSHFSERIGTGASDFSRKTYNAAFRQLKLGIDDLVSSGQIQKTDLSWFEVVTIFAMLCFRTEKVDFAIYEVGMGGRLDTTNIVTPICCCFGPIELEHTKYFGNNLSDITKEKAGILKYKIPAISVPQPSDVKKVLNETALSLHTKIEYLPSRYKSYISQDAEIAKRAVKKYLPNISEDLMNTAIQKVSLPGRFEIVTNISKYPNIPYLLIDVAHTPNSISQVLNRIKHHHYRTNLLFGCAADKDVDQIAKIIKTNHSIFKNIYLTRPGDFKKSDLNQMLAAFSKNHLSISSSSPNFTTFIPEVLSQCNSSKTPLTVLGSFYLAGEVKKII